MSDRPRVVAGVFVGGRATRFDGVPKGLLRCGPQATTLVQRAIGLCEQLGAQTLLVGSNAAYSELGVAMLQDWVPDAGPMGGLASLMNFANGRAAIALACDMPYVPIELLCRMIETYRSAEAAAVVPIRSTGLEPLCAIYSSVRVIGPITEALRQGHRSVRRLLGELHVVEVKLTAEQEWWLDDWDVPADQGR